MAHMLDLGHMAKLNVDTLSKKNYKKKTKGAAVQELLDSAWIEAAAEEIFEK